METEWTCSACGQPARITNGSYAYTESGLDHVTLKGIGLIHCDHCGNEDPMIPAIEKLHTVLAEAIISKPGRLDGKQVRFLRKYLEMSARGFAAILHVHPATVSKWENGEDPVGPQSDLLIRALVSAKREAQLESLVTKMHALDSLEQASDITVNSETLEYEYA